jgi:phenylalanyl-tRNA synthetase alpha chain
MRLIATGRALRAGSGRWSIGPSACGRLGPSFRQQQQHAAVGLRCLSSSAAQDEKLEVSRETTKSHRQFSTGPSKQITVEGKSYLTDQWTNTTDTILSHVSRRLYLDENHPLAITRKLIESQFPGPVFGNFAEQYPVVTTAQNFDVLGFPPDHPGRSRTDTYYINEKTVLRTHTSAHQSAYFQRIKSNEKSRPQEEGYTVTADVYRRDAVDRSHYPVFHQMEGARLWRRPKVDPLQHSAETAAMIRKDLESIPPHGVEVDDPNPTIHPERNPLQAEYHSVEEVEAMAAHLKRSLERMVVKIFTEASKAARGVDAQQEALKLRWVEAYFPFTSPSWELEVFWQGDWLEVLGCGITKQELLISSGVSDRVAWAFGIGLERIAMLLFNIPDIRLFWTRDERFLSQFTAGKITRFEPFSKYPACYKDVAFWLRSSTASGGSAAGGAVPFHENDIMEIVRDLAGDLVEDVRLVDEFTHPKTGRKSLCYRINYRSLERTLTNQEVNDLHEQVREKLVEKAGVELR